MDDYISRADAVKTVIRMCSPICEWQDGTQQYPDCVVAEINALPSADAVSRKAKCCPIAETCMSIDCPVSSEYIGRPSADADGEDLIIKGAKGIQDGLYNIKDGKLFKYKAKGGTVRTYPIFALSADAVPIVYCMDCAKSVPLDEHGALWKCKAHDRTTLRHSYCNNGERKGGDTE